MSVHGVCFDNCQSGRCNFECEDFQDGICDASEEVIEDLYNNYKTDPMTNNLEYDLQFGFGDVKLWVLRHGEKMSDLELLTKLLGY